LNRDHRPYLVKKAYLAFQKRYTAHFVQPHFKVFGKGSTFVKPWYVEVFGYPIEMGNFVHVIASADQRVRLSVWSEKPGLGHIRVGDYCLICPGVRISSASEISIGKGCMMASNVYITDADWHDTYNRTAMGVALPVKIEDNVWIGDSVIICKGVCLGRNSIVGAGAVVTKSIPENTIAAGNPAKIVKRLNPSEIIIGREQWFSDPKQLAKDLDRIDREMLRGNNLFHWIRHLLFPLNRD
jgi:acetyltransferase-like isoleucine patch superfamily enzyme